MTFNLNFWSAVFGLIGTIIIFFFGLPPKINQDGESYFLLEQTDQNEQYRAKSYKKISYLGLGLIAVSFLLQIISSIK